MNETTEGVQSVLDKVGSHERVAAILRCLSCSGPLVEAPTGLACVACRHQYPVVNGVVRFVDGEHYARSFGFQWLTFRKTQLDTDGNRASESAFRDRTGFSPEDLAGKFGPGRGLRHGALR